MRSLQVDATKVITAGSYRPIHALFVEFDNSLMFFLGVIYCVNMYCVGMDQVIAISDLTTGDVIQRLRGHNGSVQAICFDANKILTGSIDCTLR